MLLVPQLICFRIVFAIFFATSLTGGVAFGQMDEEQTESLLETSIRSEIENLKQSETLCKEPAVNLKDKLIASQIEISNSRYQNKLAKMMKKNPSNTLYINLLPTGSKDQYFENLKTNWKLKRKVGMQITGKSIKDTLEKLQALPQEATFDRIEIAAHSNPNVLDFNGQSIYRSDPILREFKKLKIAKPSAELVLNSCLTARSYNRGFSKDADETLLSRLAANFLTNGGKAYGTTKILTNGLPHSIVNVSGLWPLTTIQSFRNDLPFYKAYTDRLKHQPDVVMVEVPTPSTELKCHSLAQIIP